MIILYRKIREGDLELTCKLGTYLYAICKKIWIQEKRKFQLHREKLSQRPLVVHEPAPDEDPLMKIQLKKLFDKHFSQLSPDCQKILSMFFNYQGVEEIREAMGYKDLHHAADRKYRCKKSLVKRIMNDPLFKRLKNESR
jgi:DNA-directed RNA polymerase specialized sigma24 family protein